MMYKIRYKHVVIVFGACIESIFNAIIMEYMLLGSLYDVLHKQNDNITLTWLDRYSLSWQMAKYLHNLNPCIIHRDIKSMNFLMKLNGCQQHRFLLKVCDFGLADIRHESLLKSINNSISSQKNEYVDEIVIEALIKIEERPKIPLDIPEEYKQAIEDSWNQDPSKRPSCFNLMEQMFKQMKNMKQIVELTTTAIDLYHQQKKTNLC
ncbi:unnamed protein product [Rotaria sp. Silwood1]|nr:unnamed protein product [Rotaria sp. Silwood1]CAF3496621.1 unnamed protein product [Rotaria sp. Silwood1]CAF5061996.1 unnamed protein product [Rotaria sp. Silwood1]CAF5100745.1 unnamed protein product [Rotaria sp. Silwood1]